MSDSVPGFKSVLAEKPEFHFPQCFLGDNRLYTKMFPKLIDPYVCATYEAIQQLPNHPAAESLIAQLIRFGVTFVGIVTFEGSRQTSFWLKQSDLYLFIAQATSGAVAIPVYFAAVQEDSRPRPKPSSEDAWASLIGVLVGFLGPIYYGTHTGWRGNALNLFLLYPMLIWVVRSLTRAVLRPLVRDQSHKLPLLLQALAGIVVSSGNQFALYRNFTLDQVLRPALGVDLVQDLHAMLLADFAITATALLSHVVLYSYGDTPMRVKTGVISGTILLSIIAGPGGAISIAWVYGELHTVRGLASKLAPAAQKKSR